MYIIVIHKLSTDKTDAKELLKAYDDYNRNAETVLDSIAEGIMKGDFSNTWDKYYYNVIGDCICHKTFKTPKEAFASLIDKVSGKDTWKSNPYVFVYEFKLIE